MKKVVQKSFTKKDKTFLLQSFFFLSVIVWVNESGTTIELRLPRLE